MPATNAQVQQFANERVRPRSEQMRALFANIDDDINKRRSLWLFNFLLPCVMRCSTLSKQRLVRALF